MSNQQTLENTFQRAGAPLSLLQTIPSQGFRPIREYHHDLLAPPSSSPRYRETGTYRLSPVTDLESGQTNLERVHVRRPLDDATHDIERINREERNKRKEKRRRISRDERIAHRRDVDGDNLENVRGNLFNEDRAVLEWRRNMPTNFDPDIEYMRAASREY